MHKTVAHPDLSLVIYNLNHNSNIKKDIEILLDHVRNMITSNGKLTKDEMYFIKLQLSIIDTLKLFPLRRLN